MVIRWHAATWFSIILPLQYLYLVTGSWQWDFISGPVPPKSNVRLHNTLFLCILHNVWLGFLIFIFYIADTTTSIMLFSLPLILYAIFPLSLQKYSSFAHVSEKRTAYLTMELRGNVSGKISAYIHPCTSWFLPLHLPIGSGLYFAVRVAILTHFFLFWLKLFKSV